MKNLFALLAFASINLSAQISFENTYPTPVPAFNSGLVQLSTSRYKYLIRDSNDVVLYNLNHTVFRSFTIPPLPAPANYIGLRFVSEELFNTNPADIEYLVYYTDTIGPFIGIQHVIIFDETGNILFSRDSATVSNAIFDIAVPFQGIATTSSGVKMLVSRTNTLSLEVYSLPGSLPCQECTGGIISGIAPNVSSSGQQQHLPNPYPNPTNSSTTIPYELPAGINTGSMVIYDMLGNEVKRYNVSNAFNIIIVDSGELAPGTYTYNLQSTQGVTLGKRFIIAE